MRRSNTSKIADVITAVCIGAGVAGTIIIAPNALSLLDKPIKKLVDKKEQEHLTRTALYYMKQRKYIEIEELGDGAQKITVTEKGKQRYMRRQFGSLQIKPQNIWDKKWRIVLFDIPESHKSARNALNFKLKELGFKQLQKSAWVYPFPCDVEIEAIKFTYGIEEYVSLFEATDIDTHNQLVKEFGHLLR